MTRFDGTAARQLDLLDYRPPAKVKKVRPAPAAAAAPRHPRRPDLRLLKQDVYAALERRRRLAQIAARHAVERE